MQALSKSLYIQDLDLEWVTETIDVLDNWRVTVKKRRMMARKYVIT
jgi:hypothetical protein